MDFRGPLMALFVAATVLVDLVVLAQRWPRGAGTVVEACLMLSQCGLLVIWSVVGPSSLRTRLLLLLSGIGVWSSYWSFRSGFPTTDVALLLALSAVMITIPVAFFRSWPARGAAGRQFSLAALVGLLTAAGLMLGLARQFSRPSDLRYLLETCGIATATSLITAALAITLLGSRLVTGHIAWLGFIIGIAGVVLSATIVGDKWTAWVVVLLHALLVVASLSVWRICGVRLSQDSSPPSTLDPRPSTTPR